MRNITLLDDEWSGLQSLAPAPRQRASAETDVGREILRFLIEKGLVECLDDLVTVTAVGHTVLRADPPPSSIGIRVWAERAN